MRIHTVHPQNIGRNGKIEIRIESVVKCGRIVIDFGRNRIVFLKCPRYSDIN